MDGFSAGPGVFAFGQLPDITILLFSSVADSISSVQSRLLTLPRIDRGHPRIP